MKPAISGDQALAMFNAAMKLVREGKHEEARTLYPQMLESDTRVIEGFISKAEGSGD